MLPAGTPAEFATHLAVYDPKKGISYRLFKRTCNGNVTGVYVPILPPRPLAPYPTRPAFQSKWIPKPAVGTAPPDRRTWVNLGMWFWTTTPWEPQSAWAGTFDLNGRFVWAQTTATPIALTFTPGDGSAAVTCQSPGTVWNEADGDEKPSPTGCEYTYEHSSVMAPNGRTFPAKLTITWHVEWQGSDGAGDVLPDMTSTTDIAMTVGEIQAIVTG